MKRYFPLLFLLLIFSSVYAQDENLIKEIQKQAVKIDSLEKASQSAIDSLIFYKSLTGELSDSLKTVTAEMSSLKGSKKESENLSTKVKQQSETIKNLRDELAEKEKTHAADLNKAQAEAAKEREDGRAEVLGFIKAEYKNKSFDAFIEFYTPARVQLDKMFIGSHPDFKPILEDLEIYYDARRLLREKFEKGKIEDAENQLKSIQRQSNYLDDLKNKLSLYEVYNDGLKEMLESLIELDKNEVVKGMSKEIQCIKYGKVTDKLSVYFNYIFNYDFNLEDYPYLTEIILEVIKRKEPNPDANISDLLEKL